MYLVPQHFQAQARFFEEAIQFTRDCFWPYGYGYVALEIDDNELSQGNFALHHMRGVMPDGAAFDISSREELPQRRVEDIFPPTGGSLALMLALPRQHEKDRNVESNPPERREKYRFRATEIEVADTNTGIDREPVGFLKQNFRIATTNEVGPDDTWIPIARVARDGQGRYVADPEFVPPCLQVATSSCLHDQVNHVLDFLTANSHALSARRRASAQRAEARFDPKALAEFWLLHTLNSAIPVLRHWETGCSPHPAEAFRVLAQLAGTLSTFSAEGDIQQLPKYDHMSPGECFSAVIGQIRRTTGPDMADACITVPLERIYQNTQSDDSFFGGKIDDPRCYQHSRWILAIHADVPNDYLKKEMPHLAQIASRKYLKELISKQALGIPLTWLDKPPSSCPERFDRIYFEIDTADPLFELIRRDHTIGLYLAGLIRRPEVELQILIEGGKS